MTQPRLRAAGGVASRPGPGGPEVMLVHRPRFDDWSLPKGKLKRGEFAVVGAVREVHEETGIRGVVGPRLPTVSYDVWSGDALVEKIVDYWTMSVGAMTPFRPGSEVDDVAWLPIRSAIERATYPHDKRVLRTFADQPLYRPPIVVLRHASAGERAGWPGPDHERPLDSTGSKDAVELAAVLACFGPTTLVSAEPLRCQQTLSPLAESIGETVRLDAAFNEETDPVLAARHLRELATSGIGTVVCSQGALIPALLAEVSGQTAARYHTGKGEGWVLNFPADQPDRPPMVDELPLDRR